MKKKLIFKTALVCSITIFLLAGCKGGEDFPSSDQGSQQQQKIDDKGNVVTVGNEFTKILRTGQISTYALNDDGAYQRGLPRNFTKSGDVVVDNSTGLIWQDNADVTYDHVIWSLAGTNCKNLILGGYDNWRLPSIKELVSITDKSIYNPSIDDSFHAIDPDKRAYWTSVINQENPSEAWYVDFYDGSQKMLTTSGPGHSRCVSSGR